MIRRALIAGWLLAGVASSPHTALAIDADSYRAAVAAGSVGAVAGRVYEEAKRP